MNAIFAGALDSLLAAPAALISTFDLPALGIAYLVLLGNIVVATLCFAAARAFLVVSPNPGARDYGLYVSAVLVALASSMVIENGLRQAGTPVLPYAAAPHLAILLTLHLAIYWRQTPWLVTLGASSMAGAIPVVAALGLLTQTMRLPHWIALALAAVLLIFLWRNCVSTKRSFLNADSIHTGTKELRHLAIKRQTPWLGLPQWVALAFASLALAAVNEVLRGAMPLEIPAAGIGIEATALLAITAGVSSLPAASYWLARKAWMPELTRLVWLVWLVVAFAFTYRNLLTRMLSA